jgi:predicted RNase H-like HicB family nuclease
MLWLAIEELMNPVHVSELIFEVTQEADSGYVAECLTESIVTQGDTSDELRANVKDAVEGYFFDGPKSRSIRLRMVRDEVLVME